MRDQVGAKSLPEPAQRAKRERRPIDLLDRGLAHFNHWFHVKGF